MRGFVWKGADITIIIPSGTGIGYNSKKCTMSATAYEVIPETVGQFTGSLDDNGSLIFERDIVQGYVALGKIITELVTYNEDLATYVAGDYPLSRIMALRKVGNIHDYPELLEVEK